MTCASTRRPGLGAVPSDASDLVGLQDLEMLHVVDTSTCTKRLRGRARDPQIERLLPVADVAGGHVSRDDEREIVLAQIASENVETDAFLGEDLLLGRLERRAAA